MKRIRQFRMFPVPVLVLLLVFAVGSAGYAGLVGISDITIAPAQPTDSDPIALTASGWIGYAYDIQMTGYDYSVIDRAVTMDVYFLDTNPGGVGLPIAGGWEADAAIGPLAEGNYEVIVKAWISDSPTLPYYELADSKSDTFSVVPEPATLLLVGLGVMLTGGKRRK